MSHAKVALDWNENSVTGYTEQREDNERPLELAKTRMQRDGIQSVSARKSPKSPANRDMVCAAISGLDFFEAGPTV